MPRKTAGKPTRPTPAPADAQPASKRIDALIAGLGDWRGERLAELRRLILEADPEVVEAWKWMGSPVWEHAGNLAVANAHKDKVKITFSQGAHLSDPRKVFNAGLGGSQWRAIDLGPDDVLHAAGFQALVREAVAYNLARTASKGSGSKKKTPGGASAAGARQAARPTRSRAGDGKSPQLLSGDNPRIAKGDGDAPVQAFLDAIPGWKQDTARRLDALVARTVPGVKKAVKWNSPFYGVEGQGWFLNFHCFKSYLKVAFFKGEDLSPPPPEASTRPEVRYLHLYEDTPWEEARLKDWIRQAAALPGWMA